MTSNLALIDEQQRNNRQQHVQQLDSLQNKSFLEILYAHKKKAQKKTDEKLC